MSAVEETNAPNRQSTANSQVKVILGVRACDCGIQGPENLILALCDRLGRRDVRYVVANLWDGEPPRVALHDVMTQRGYESHVIHTAFGMSPTNVSKLRRLIHELQPDVIHTHDVKAEIAALAAMVGQRRPLIGSFYGRLQLASLFLRVADLARFVLFRFYDRILANSQMQRSELVQFRVPQHLIDMLPSFVDTTSIQPPNEDERATARAIWGIRPQQIVLTTIARLAINKGHRYMLDALPEIIARFPDVVYLVPGEGDMHWRGEGGLRVELERHAKDLGVADNVRFIGYVEDVHSVMRAADLLVSPSLLEGMQVALLEAMATALPIVATNIGGTPDAVLDGVTGVLVPPADPKSLALAVISLLETPSRMRAMGVAGRERVTSLFDATIVTDNFLTYCEEASALR